MLGMKFKQHSLVYEGFRAYFPKPAFSPPRPRTGFHTPATSRNCAATQTRDEHLS